jgi:O-antigen ligase
VFLVLASYLLFSSSARRYGWGIWFGCGLVIGFALVLSYTRSVWLALLAAGGYLVWHWNRKLLLAVPAVLLLLGVLSPGAVQRRLASMANPDANSNRLIMWQTGASMIKAHPWLGVGPERVGPRFAEFMPSRFASMDELPPAYYNHLHNIYVHYAAERGLPAMLMLLWLLAKVVLDHQRALARLGRGPGDEKFLLRAVIAATIGVAVVGCFDLTLGDSEILGFYLTLIALGYGAVARVHRAVDAGVPIA